MSEKTDERILNEIEVHSSNAVILLKKSHEIQKFALDLDNLDAYIEEMHRALAFQKLSVQEMQKAIELQNILSQRINSLQYMKSKFGLF